MVGPDYLRLQVLCLLGTCICSAGWKYDKNILDVTYYSERVLTVTTILIEPYTMLHIKNKSIKASVPNGNGYNSHSYHHINSVVGSSTPYEGYIVDLLNHLAHIIGFRYRLVPVWDGQFGHEQPDGTWDGMIGELVRKEADISAAPMFITGPRRKVVDFTHSFMDVQATILLRRPPDGIPHEIETPRDLVQKPWYSYGTLNRGVIRRAFKFSNNSLHKAMWDYMLSYEDRVLTETNEEGIQKVRQKNNHYAFILPDNIADYIVRKKPCDLMMTSGFLMNKGYGLGVPKGSALLPYLNRAIDTMREDGTLKRLYEKWWVATGECDTVQTSRIFSLNGSSGKLALCHYVTLGLFVHSLSLWVSLFSSNSS